MNWRIFYYTKWFFSSPLFKGRVPPSRLTFYRFSPLIICSIVCFASVTFSAEPGFEEDTVAIPKPFKIAVDQVGIDYYSVDELENKLNNYRTLFLETKRLGVFLRRRMREKEVLIGFHLTLFYDKFIEFSRASAELKKYLDRIGPGKPKFESNARKELLWTYGQVLLIDSVFDVCDLFLEDDELRGLLRGQDGARALQLVSSLKTFQRILDEHRLENLESWFAEVIHFLKSDSPQLNGLTEGWDKIDPVTLLLDTEVFNTIQEGRRLSSVYSSCRLGYQVDRFYSLLGGLKRGVGWILGTPTAFVRWQHGSLYKNKELQRDVAENLQPLDLLVRKRYSCLTNYIIPGYWTHSAVWLGTREQLIELGVWDNPALAPFREEIEKGDSIYEALYNGLNCNPLQEFLDLDEVAILRVRGLIEKEPDKIAAVYRNLARQRDKKYDYSFDVTSTGQVLCTEVISLSYGNIDWPSGKLFGRRMFSPDNLAQFVFYKNSPLKLIAFYQTEKNGEFYEKDLSVFGKTVNFFPKDYSPADNADPVFIKREKNIKPIFSFRNGGIWLQWRVKYKEERPCYFAPSSERVP